MQQHKSVTFNFEKQLLELTVLCIMPGIQVPYPQLLDNLSHDCRLIAIKTSKFSLANQDIIKAETERLLNEGRIEIDCSSLGAQTLVVS